MDAGLPGLFNIRSADLPGLALSSGVGPEQEGAHEAAQELVDHARSLPRRAPRGEVQLVHADSLGPGSTQVLGATLLVDLSPPGTRAPYEQRLVPRS